MPQEIHALDRAPADLRAAASDLAVIANICLKAGLPNAGRRAATLADWLAKQTLQTVDLGALDAELLAIGTRVEPPAGAVHGRHSTFHAPPAVPEPVHQNTDAEGLVLVRQHIARGGPTGTSELAKLLGMRKMMAKQKLKRWRSAGHLVTIGKGGGSRWALPDAPRAEAVTSGAARPGLDAPGNPEARLQARDAGVLKAIKEAGTNGIEEKHLAKALPPEPDQTMLPTTRLQGVLRRLGLKALIEFRDGRFYPVAA